MSYLIGFLVFGPFVIALWAAVGSLLWQMYRELRRK